MPSEGSPSTWWGSRPARSWTCSPCLKPSGPLPVPSLGNYILIPNDCYGYKYFQGIETSFSIKRDLFSRDDLEQNNLGDDHLYPGAIKKVSHNENDNTNTNHNSVFLSYPNSNEDFAPKPHEVKVTMLHVETHEAAEIFPENDVRNYPNIKDAKLSGVKEGNSYKD